MSGKFSQVIDSQLFLFYRELHDPPQPIPEAQLLFPVAAVVPIPSSSVRDTTVLQAPCEPRRSSSAMFTGTGTLWGSPSPKVPLTSWELTWDQTWEQDHFPPAQQPALREYHSMDGGHDKHLPLLVRSSDSTWLIRNVCVHSSFFLKYLSFSLACLFYKLQYLLPHTIRRKYRLKCLNV